MYNKSGLVFYNLLIRDLEGLELRIEYLFNYKHFVINHITKNVDHYNVYLYIINLRSYVT